MKPVTRACAEEALVGVDVQVGWTVVNWHRFAPADFEYDFERDELGSHGVIFEEAVECFFSDFVVRRNKSYHDRFQLVGRTIGGRRLKIISKPPNIQRTFGYS